MDFLVWMVLSYFTASYVVGDYLAWSSHRLQDFAELLPKEAFLEWSKRQTMTVFDNLTNEYFVIWLKSPTQTSWKSHPLTRHRIATAFAESLVSLFYCCNSSFLDEWPSCLKINYTLSLFASVLWACLFVWFPLCPVSVPSLKKSYQK